MGYRATDTGTHIMEIAGKDALLQWSHKHLQKLQVKCVQSHLTHMNVTCGHRLVAALQTLVVIAAIGPFAMRFHDGNQIITERICNYLEPEDIRTRLRYHCAFVQLHRVVLVYVL